jgi:isorenieratene synthase
LPTHDDGVLTWARLAGEEQTPAPILAPRPERFVSAVVRVEARCDPPDVIANRLDPWHGVHFHGHSFGRLRVTAWSEEEVRVRVVYRVLGPVGVEVDAVFSCPDPRTIVMTIVGGVGKGSVVETHATPMAPGRTAIIEATLATGGEGIRWAAPLVRPLLERAARRLWVDDAAYAERRFALRERGRRSGSDEEARESEG